MENSQKHATCIIYIQPGITAELIISRLSIAINAIRLVRGTLGILNGLLPFFVVSSSMVLGRRLNNLTTTNTGYPYLKHNYLMIGKAVDEANGKIDHTNV